MNLKRLRGIAAVALATIAAAIFAGCSNSMAGSVDGDSNARMATLSLSATGIPNEYAEQIVTPKATKSVGARSILPDDPYEIGSTSGQSATLELVLTGKSETGMTYGPKVVGLTTGVTVDGITVYDFDETITLDPMSWNLVLTAYSDNAHTKPVLQGFCSADLRNGSGTATFVMSIAGLTTKGSVDISGTIVDESKVAKSYTMGIYRKDDGKDAGGTEQTVTAFDVATGNTFTFTANGNEVSPGTYLYTMIFYNADNAIVGSFTDTIVINPGNKLTKTGLTVDVIGKKPTEPKDLKAYLVDGSESSDGRTYNVKVTWEQADYATNYELNVVEFDENNADNDDIDTYFTPDATTKLIKNGTIYGMASMDKTTPTKIVKDFPGSAVFGTGSSSMMYGDDSCVLKLETGKVYEIQLRARNYIGVSDWVDRIDGGTETGCTAYKAPNDQRINRLLITYKLNGGTFKKAGAQAVQIGGIYTEYTSWIFDDSLMVITTNGTDSDNTLIKGATPNIVDFAAWQLDEGTAVKADGNDTATRGDEVEKYTYKNVSVIASFGNKLSGAISQEAVQTDIKPTDITVAAGTEGSPVTVTATDEIYNVTKLQADKTPTWVQVSLSNVGTDYSNVKFEVWSQSASKNDAETLAQSVTGQCKVNTAKYTSGKMYILVTADTKTATSVSRTIIIDLK